MLGGGGDDTLTAKGDDDVVMRGNAGNDSMSFVGGVGGIEVFGDDGNDLAVIVNQSGGNLSGGRGDDDLSLFSDTSSSNGRVQGGAGDDTIRVEAEFGDISGGGGDDRISALMSEGVLNGDSGNDVVSIVGGDFSSQLLGGTGNDVLINGNVSDEALGDDIPMNGGRGSDLLRGGSGADVFQFALNDRGADVVENFVAGEDLLEFKDTGLQFADVDTNDSASLDAGDDAVSSIGNDLVIDVAAAADVDFLNTVTVVDTLSVAEADTSFIYSFGFQKGCSAWRPGEDLDADVRGVVGCSGCSHGSTAWQHSLEFA